MKTKWNTYKHINEYVHSVVEYNIWKRTTLTYEIARIHSTVDT